MIVARFDHAHLDAEIANIINRGRDLTAPLASCGEVMLTSIDKNFEVQGRYASAESMRGGSTRWEPLAESTKRARIGGSRAFTNAGTLRKKARAKLAGLKILQQSGHLAASFSKQVGGNTLTIGSNLIYAAIHNYGGQAGRGHRVTIPARPMLVVQDEDVDDMLEILRKHTFH